MQVQHQNQKPPTEQLIFLSCTFNTFTCFPRSSDRL
ncbi:unnamed protein product [Prunus brigantina]